MIPALNHKIKQEMKDRVAFHFNFFFKVFGNEIFLERIFGWVGMLELSQGCDAMHFVGMSQVERELSC